MFTGIVEEIGTIGSLTRTSTGVLHVCGHTVLEGTSIGESIAVNGVCLTVTRVLDDGFTADLQPVTRRLTNLGLLSRGDSVNLERSVGVGQRFGGHYVQGHIDGIARINRVTGDGPSIVVRLDLDGELLRYVVERGFIAIDGASLTVMRCWPDGVDVSLVYHTQQAITLPLKRPGERVNIEVDVIAKYVEQLAKISTHRDDLSMDFLHQHGFV